MKESKGTTLNIKQIKEALQANIIVGNEENGNDIDHIYASDLMSDVLAYGKPGSLLLTGLNTVQAAISAYMAEFSAVVFIRGKKPAEDIQTFANEKGLIILSTNADMFEACIRIASINNDLQMSPESIASSEREANITTHKFCIDGRNFAGAGMVSTQIKTILKSIGYDPAIIRRVAISTYEGEMNVVMHAVRANVTLMAADNEIIVIIDDEGKGIPDVEQAMQEGFSTATEDQRAMGFGSGMGLPNIKRNADDLKVESTVGKGTRVEMKFIVS